MDEIFHLTEGGRFMEVYEEKEETFSFNGLESRY